MILVSFVHFDERRSEVHGTDSSPEFGVIDIYTSPEVNMVSVDSRCWESRVRRVFKFYTAGVDFFRNHSKLCTYSEFCVLCDLHIVGILERNFLLVEDAKIVAEQAYSRSMVGIEEIDRHISPHIKRFRCIVESDKLHGVCRSNVEHTVGSTDSWVIEGLEAGVVGELRLILRRSPLRHHHRQGNQYITKFLQVHLKKIVDRTDRH